MQKITNSSKMNNDSEKMSSRSSQTGSSKKDHGSNVKKDNIIPEQKSNVDLEDGKIFHK